MASMQLTKMQAANKRLMGSVYCAHRRRTEDLSTGELLLSGRTAAEGTRFSVLLGYAQAHAPGAGRLRDSGCSAAADGIAHSDGAR